MSKFVGADLSASKFGADVRASQDKTMTKFLYLCYIMVSFYCDIGHFWKTKLGPFLYPESLNWKH